MMPEQAKIPRPRRRWWIGAVAGTLVLAAFIGAAWYLRSPGFEDLVRRKVIAALEDATGGRVEMASFRWNLSQLTFAISDLTIHGLEPPDQLPFAHVDHALVRLRIVSFFERQVSVERLELQRPVVHLIVNPDGSTNVPEPKVKQAHRKSPVQELFDLAIGRAEVRSGMLLVNERRQPLDFSANDIVAAMMYAPAAQRFDGKVRVGKIDLQFQDYRDLPATVDAEFSLWHNAAEIRSLTLTSQGSSLEASGKITDFDQPQVQLTYKGALDVAQVGSVTRTPQLRGGTLLLDGSADYSYVAGYATNGHIRFRDFDYLDDGLSLRRANLSSNFSLAQNRLALTGIAARLLGGEIAGNAEIKNLVPAQVEQPKQQVVPRTAQRRTATAPPAAGQQQGSAQLQVSRLSLNELARMMSSRSLPLYKLNAAGSVTGSVNASWKGSAQNAVAELALDISAPAQAAANQLPVSGSVRGRYSVRAERFELAALNLTTPHSRVVATGSLGSTSATLKLNANTTGLTDFEPLLSAMSSAPLPIELAGTASFDGTLSGRLRAPQIVGHVTATDLTYLYTPPALTPHPATRTPSAHKTSKPVPSAQAQPAVSASKEQRRLHVDELSGDVQYSQSDFTLHHGVVQEGGAQLTVAGSAALNKGNFTDDSQFQLQAALHNGDVVELLQRAGLDYPVKGTLSFTVQAAGTAANPHGRGQASLGQGEVHGRPFDALVSKFAFADHAVQFHEIHLEAAHGMVAGSAAYDFRSGEGNLDLKGRSVDLAGLPEVQTERLQVAGTANFTVKGSGTLERPVVNAHLEIASLVLNNEIIGTVTADAVTEGRQLTLTARSKFPRATFTLDGHVLLDGDMPANAVLRFTNLDVNPFLPARMRSQVTRQASLDGQAQLAGPLRQPHQLYGTVNVQQFSVEVQHIPIRSDGPVQLSFADAALTIQRCLIVSEDTHFSLTGTVSLRHDPRLDLHANGSLNLKLAQTVDPDVTSYGMSNINLNIGGAADRPTISGLVEVVHAGISLVDLPTGLGDLNGTLVFNQDRLEVQQLTGRVGGGHVKLGGFVTYGGTLGFNLTAEGTDIRLRYSGISVTFDQSLRLSGTLQNSSVTGNVTVTRFAQIPSSDLQFLLTQASVSPSIPNPKSPLNNVHLEVRILSTPELTVESSLAKLSGDVDLRLRGTVARPVLLGRINIAEGDIKLAGTKYHLERGDLTFINPVRIDPVLDVEATTRVRDYDITIGLHGTLERLNTTYRSDPPLSTDDIISLLAFGRTQTENALGNSTGSGFAESASGALLSSALNQTVTNRVSRIFGSSTIRINPSLGGPENDPNARLTLEQQVSNDITLTYVTNLARSAQEVIQFEYNINSDYTLQGIRDENGVVSFDLLIRKRRR